LDFGGSLIRPQRKSTAASAASNGDQQPALVNELRLPLG
jgi:hypothetical protein